MLYHTMDARKSAWTPEQLITRYFQLPKISFTQNCWVGDLLANREYKIRVWSLIVIVSVVVPALPAVSLNTLTDAVFFACISLTRFA